MANLRAAFLLALLFELVSAPSLYAHHGHANYDMKTTIVLMGKVTEFTLANPHSSIAFDVKDEQGNDAHWVVEFGVLRDLISQGWKTDTLKPGDEIKIAVHPRRDGEHAGIVDKEISYADGRPIPLTPPPAQRYTPHIIRW
jgi:hypothetical protein